MRKIIIASGIVLFWLSSCTVMRAVRYWEADIDDHRIFPYTEINTGDDTFRFKKVDEETLGNYIVKARNRNKKDTVDLRLDDFLEKTTKTVSFIVIRNDTILYERYFRGYDRSTISTVFSVSKSVTSLLTGIALDEGYIESVHDSVTKYVLELKGKDPMFERLTIDHLLNMRAGFKFNEDKHTLFSRATRVYYGRNLLKTIEGVRFANEPGVQNDYQTISSALLGIIVERATGQELGKYLEEKVWIPMGMENRATWSLDDRRHRTAKAATSLNATAIDLAKIGRLYLHNGQWEGKQIVDSAWIKKSVTPDIDNSGYQNNWYSMDLGIRNPETKTSFYVDSLSAERYMSTLPPAWREYYRIWQDELANQWRITVYSRDFYALGIRHQTVYVHPGKNIIVVRLGESSDMMNYPGFIYDLIRDLR